MAKVTLQCDETDPLAVADECDRVANLRPRDFVAVKYIQLLLSVAATHLRKRRTGKHKAADNAEITAGT